MRPAAFAATLLLVLVACTSRPAPSTSPVASSSAPSVQPAAASSPAARPAPSVSPAASVAPQQQSRPVTLKEFPLPKGEHPHDVAPTADGMVWYTAQVTGEAGRLDPKTGEVRLVKLGQGSAPHGIIVGPDKALWITDGGLNAIVRLDPATEEVKSFRLPANRAREDLNTATFDLKGRLWFTGQAGVHGRLDPATGKMDVFDAPNGRGPYGMTSTVDGGVYFASLAGSYVGRIDPETGQVTVLQPPTPNQGARRVWADGTAQVWVSEWDAGKLGLYGNATGVWAEWDVPAGGQRAQVYAVYADENHAPWVTEWRTNALVRFDPNTRTFDAFPFPTQRAEVRQIAGRPGEVWGAESATDKLVVAVHN